jgi:hypothetical protein
MCSCGFVYLQSLPSQLVGRALTLRPEDDNSEAEDMLWLGLVLYDA